MCYCSNIPRYASMRRATSRTFLYDHLHTYGKLELSEGSLQHVPDRRNVCFMVEEATIKHRVRVWVGAGDMDGAARERVFCGRRIIRVVIEHAYAHTKVLEHREIFSRRHLKSKVSSCYKVKRETHQGYGRRRKRLLRMRTSLACQVFPTILPLALFNIKANPIHTNLEI